MLSPIQETTEGKTEQTSSYGVIWEGFSEELTHPVSRDQQKKECPERMYTGKDPK